MELREYIKCLKTYGNFWGYPQDVLCDLIDAAVESELGISPDTAKNWLKKGKQNPIRQHFADREVKETSFIKFVKAQVNTDWKRLQTGFRDLNTEHGFVDVDTKDEEQFYRSLLWQFQKLVGLPVRAYALNSKEESASRQKGNTSGRDKPQVIQSPVEPSVPITNMLPLSTDAFSADSGGKPKGMKSEQISKPRYMRDSLKSLFENYAISREELNPYLLQWWSSVCIANEFFYCFEHFNVADFIVIDPLDFGSVIGEIKLGTAGDGLDHVLRTLKFVNQMEIAIEYVPIYDETEEIHIAISTYVTTLHKYIDFLREHSINQNLLGNTFYLVPNEYDDKDELERKSKKYRDNLQSQYEEIKKMATSNEAM